METAFVTNIGDGNKFETKLTFLTRGREGSALPRNYMETEELVERPVSAQDKLSCVSAPLKCRSGGDSLCDVGNA